MVMVALCWVTGDSRRALGKRKQEDCGPDWNVRRGKWEVRAFYIPRIYSLIVVLLFEMCKNIITYFRTCTILKN